MGYALVTGSSGGIGLSLAEELARRGYSLLLVARSEDKLAHHCKALSKRFNVASHYYAVDLTVKGADEELIDWVIKNNWPLEVLVNNAGYAVWGNFHEAKLNKTKNMMQLNIDVLVSLCYKAIPLLQKQPRSYILNVASTSAYQAVPTLSIYAASKSFVLSFSRGLRLELKESGISVSCLSPGVTSTNFMDRAQITDDLKKKAIKVSMTSHDVAKIAVAGMIHKKAEIIPGWINKVSVKLVGLAPKYLPEKVASLLYRKAT